MTSPRTYERTHPWLKFEAKLDPALPLLWILLGEARSKCGHIAGVPLPPGVATYLHRLYLAKGMQGSAAIEGNTLTREQVEQHLLGKLNLPPSQKYLQKEIDNILAICNQIDTDELHAQNPALTAQLIKSFNRAALDGLELEKDVVPGEIRTHNVGVLRYLGAPAEDCEYLLDRMCTWLNSPAFDTNDSFGLAVPILKAVLAHLYIAWIHPFGDGNGRTARMVEFFILVHAGVPTPAAHLLSNHYNLTRTAYYRELDKASQSGGDVRPFMLYALQGFVDQLREQIETIQVHQINVAWRDYVNERFDGKNSKADVRRKKLVLMLSWLPSRLRRKAMLTVPSILEVYGGKTIKTLTRDLNALVGEGLVDRTRTGFRARSGVIFGFLPPQRKPDKHMEDVARRQLDLPLNPQGSEV